MLEVLQEIKDEDHKLDYKYEIELNTLKTGNDIVDLYAAIAKDPENQARTIKNYEDRQPIGPVRILYFRMQNQSLNLLPSS